MRVTTVESERAALEQLEEATGGPQPYDLVLMRYSVPTLDGFDLAKRIDRSPERSGTRVMMVASEGQIGDGARCK
ncbi:response regulator, partial [Acidobacteriia bacterium AH_259_A11_L15]|nr:response regulator [Acidobacteriia bacterium AH_259_A11_L15]